MTTPATPRFRSSAAILFSGNFFESLVAFGAQVVIARYLLPEDYGRFAIMLANTSLVFLFLSLRVSTLIIRRPESELTREVRERYFVAVTLESVAGAVITLAIISSFDRVGILELILVVAIAVGHWVETNRAFYERRMDYGKIVGIDVTAKLASHALAVVLVILGAGGLVLYLREFVISVLRLVGAGATGSLGVERLRWLAPREWRSLVAEARGIWADGILEGGFQRLVILLCGAFGGTQGAGLFFFAHRLALVPNQLLMPVTGRLGANWLSRQEDPDLRRRSFHRLVAAVFAGSAVAVAGAIIIAEPVIPWLFGETWREVVPIFIALGGMILFLTVFEAIKAYCYIEGASRVMLISRLSKFIALGLVFGILYQTDMGPAEGLAFGVSAAFATAFLIGWWLLRSRARAAERT